MKNKYFRSAAAFALAMIVACGALTGCTGTKGKQQNNQKPQSSVTQQEQNKKPAQKPEQKPAQKPGSNKKPAQKPTQKPAQKPAQKPGGKGGN